jgi:hypothetical protein
MNGNSDVINRAEVRRRLIRRAQDGPTAFHWRHFNPRVSEGTLNECAAVVESWIRNKAGNLPSRGKTI